MNSVRSAMKKSKKATLRRRRKLAARSRRACRDIEAARRADVIRQFDRTVFAPPTKEIQLMSEEERKIYVHPSTN
jgi:hypothetical protein